MERVMNSTPVANSFYYERFSDPGRHGMDSIVDSSLRPGQRRPLRVIQSEPAHPSTARASDFIPKSICPLAHNATGAATDRRAASAKDRLIDRPVRPVFTRSMNHRPMAPGVGPGGAAGG